MIGGDILYWPCPSKKTAGRQGESEKIVKSTTQKSLIILGIPSPQVLGRTLEVLFGGSLAAKELLTSSLSLSGMSR